jgi:hypothetical protein
MELKDLADVKWERKLEGDKGGWQTRGTGGLCEPVYIQRQAHHTRVHTIRKGDLELTVTVEEKTPQARYVKGIPYGDDRGYCRLKEIVLLQHDEPVEIYEHGAARALDRDHDAQRLYRLRDRIRQALDCHALGYEFDYDTLKPVRPAED